MDEQERKMISLGAHLEGLSVATKHIGEKIEVSEMELIVLCNFAKLGGFSIFLDNDEVDVEAKVEKEKLIKAIHVEFGDEKADGMNRIFQGLIAILGSESFEKYILKTDQPIETVQELIKEHQNRNESKEN